MSQPNTPPRWYLRYTLRSLIIVVTLACAILGYKVNQVSRQRKAVRTLMEERAILAFDYQLEPAQSSAVPSWLNSIVGDDFFAHVEMVSFLVPFLGGPTSDNINDDLLLQLQSFPRLKRLNLQDCEQVTNSGLRHLSGLSQLQELCLSRTNVTGDGLVALSNMHQLQRLDLEEISLTDGDMANLVHLQKLEQLWLMDTAITDAGVEPLLRLKSLRKLDLSLTHVTAEGIERLRIALPQCEVYEP